MPKSPIEPPPESSGFRPAATIVPILILGCIGCILLGVRSFREPPPIAAPPPPTLTNAPSPLALPPPEPTISPVAEREASALNQAREAFGHYRQLVIAADFNAASNAFRSIDSRLLTVALQTNFWADVLPDNQRIELTLARMCLICTGGACWRCRGEGTCATCAGDGVCQSCKGKSVRMARCQTCRCSACGGTARCRACRGEARILCAACGGSGSSAVAERVACSPCRGTGKRSGLQRGEREATAMRCLTCGGAGTRATSRFGTCPSCAGSGRAACSACNGRGSCATCAGRGHRTPCTVCKDTGQVRLECLKCAGSGHCTDCAGNRRCATCNGNKMCPKCGGAGMTRLLTLAVNQAWLVQTQGFVIVDGQTGEELATNSRDGAQEPTVRERTLSFTNAPGELIWISTDGSYGQARKLMLP